MAQSYTRQSSFSDGDTITAALFNNEYSQLVNAFTYSSSSASTTGHRHDGTAGHGGNIHTIGDLDFLNKIMVSSNTWEFYVEVSSAAAKQMVLQDGALVPNADSDLDLGTSSVYFKNAYIDSITTTGAITSSSTLQGTTITATTAFVPDASDGAALGTSALEFSDLFLADGAVINFGDDQDVSLTHVADTGLLLSSTDQLQFGDSGTYIYQSADGVLDLVADTEIEINATTIDINGAADVSGNLAVGGNLTVTGNATIAGNLTFGDAATDTVAFSADVASNLLPSADNTYDIGASGSEWKDLYIDGTANIDSLVADTADINGGTVDGAIIGGSSAAAITGTTITGTSFVIGSADISEAELETIDGITAGTVIASKAIITDSNIDITGGRNITISGELDAATLDISGNADIDGTTNLDVVDIDGAVDMASTLTVAGEITAASLDISGNTDIDGTLEADAYTVDGTALNEYIADTVGAMVGSNTETNIAVTYEDGDNTLDFVIGTLNQDTTGLAATATALATARTIGGTSFDGTANIAVATATEGTNVTVSANNSTDETVYPTFVDGATGTQGIETDTGLTYNPSTGMLTSTGVTSTFTGNITGNVTGNTSGTAATVTTAAQSNITSLGTLTTLTVDNVVIDGAVIGHTSDTDLITLSSGVVTVAGEVDATSLDISGDADIDGTLEADAITVGGSTLASVIAGTTVSNATLAATATVTDSSANTNFPVVFHDESNALLDDTGALRYNPSTGELLVPKLTVAGTTTTADTVTMQASNAIIFEGATADANETTLSIVDPTADHTQYLINQGGYIPVLAAATTTAITATPAELNLLDTAAANSVVNSKAVIYGSSGELAGTLSTAAQANITSVGTLTALTGGTGDLVWDSTTLVVDSSANRIGIGNASPDVSLDIGSFTDAIHVPSGTTAQRPGSPAAGYLRYNSTTGDFEGYTDAWGAIAGAGGTAPAVDTMTGDGSDTTLTLTSAPVNENATVVTIDGVVQHKSTYSVSGNTLTFSEAPPDDTAVECITWVNTTVNSALLMQDADGDTQIQVEESSDEDKIRFDIAGTEKFVIDSTGLYSSTAGTSNTVFGAAAGDSIASGGNYNVVVGDQAGTALTTGDNNVAIGFEALKTEDANGSNVAVGYRTLKVQNAGAEAWSTAVGTDAGMAITVGIDNTLIGGKAGDALTDADYNTAVGRSALTSDTLGNKTTAIGWGTLNTQNFTSNTDSFNTAVGYNAGAAVSTGVKNTLIGGLAGDANTTGGFNTAVGYNSLTANTTADGNTAIGNDSMPANTTGASNTAVGSGSLYANTTASNNTAVGMNSLVANTTGTQNTALGALTLDANTTASYNTAVGYNALTANTTGADNTGIGRASLSNNTTGADNTALGKGSLAQNTTASNNTAVGTEALGLNTTGASNTAVGSDALQLNTTGSNNAALGYNALAANTTGGNNTALGRLALDANTTASSNTAVGAASLTTNTTGTQLVAMGVSALEANTTGSNNVAIGNNSLGVNTTASNNTALGHNSLVSNTTGSDINAFGSGALSANTTGGDNNAFGKQAMTANTTGSGNTAMGHAALDANTTADNNTAVGKSALGANTTGTLNTAVGATALDACTSGDWNTVVGYAAGGSNTSGSNNCLFGKDAGTSLTTGGTNVGVGKGTLGSTTTGTLNLAVGHEAGNNLASGASENTVLGCGAKTGATNSSHNIVIGSGLTSTAANDKVSIGKASNIISNVFATNATWARVSDERKKKNIKEDTLGLDFINDLKTVTFEWKPNHEFPKHFKDYKETAEENEMTTGLTLHGMVAQDVKAALDKAGVDTFGGWSEDAEDGSQELAQGMFVHPLIRAVQELSAKVEELESKLGE